MSNKVTVLYFIVLALACRQIANAQNINLTNWKIHSAMHNTTDATTDWDKRIWVSSTGGINIYDNFDSAATPCYTLNANSGLLDPSINALKYVPNLKTMICGSRGGVLTLINNLDEPFTYITGIRDHGLSNPTINDICLLPSSNGTNIVLIAGGFGMVEFNLDKRIFGSSIFTIGDFSVNTAVNNIMLNGDTIWIATPAGIAYTTLDKRLNVPQNWKTFPYFITDSAKTVTEQNAQMIQYHNDIYVSFPTGLYKFNGETFDSLLHIVDLYPFNWGFRFKNMAVYKDKLIASTGYEVLMFDDINNVANASSRHRLMWRGNNGVFTDNNSGIVLLEDTSLPVDIVLLYEAAGCGFWTDGAGTKQQIPNTPYTNLFCNLALADNGILYAISDNAQKNNTRGLMSFDGEKWINYGENLSDIPFDATYISLAISPYDNKIYAGTWGSGLLEMDVQKDTTFYQFWSSTNSELVAFDTNNFTLVGQTKWDSQGRLWTVSYGENGVPGNMLVTFNEDKTSTGFAAKVGDNSRYAFSLAIDANNTKWIATHALFTRGLYYFNENGTLNNLTDDVWGQIYKLQYPNLLEDGFTSIAYDNFTGTVWLGTASGMAIINNPSAALTNSKLTIISNRLLASQHINNIFIDAIGNKWISTRNGIWVLSVDGSELLANFTTSNTPLTTNDIQAVTINPNDGIIYIGTKEGLFIAQSNVLLPASDYSIKTYPQPFNLKRHNHVTIEGLTTDSDIRIVTPGGTLVRRITTSSKNAVWDGKDETGNYVPPGVYLVIASSVVTKSSGAAKVVVVE